MNKIKELRLQKGLTQLYLALKVGVSQQAVAAWEIGNRTPRLSVLRKIADVLGCTISELLEEVPSDEKKAE